MMKTESICCNNCYYYVTETSQCYGQKYCPVVDPNDRCEDFKPCNRPISDTIKFNKIKAIVDNWAVDDDEHELLEQISDIVYGTKEAEDEIDIDEETYKMCKQLLGDADNIERAIANGKPFFNDITDEQISDAFMLAIANYWESKSKYLTSPPTPCNCPIKKEERPNG